MTTSTELPPLNDFRIIEIGTLFHDIGKFKQHTMEKPTRKHQELSAELIQSVHFPKDLNKEHIEKLAHHHHDKGEKVIGLSIVRTADHVSAAMDREKDEETDPNRALQSAFSLITMDPDESGILLPSKKPVPKYYLPLPQSSSLDFAFPRDKVEKSQIIKLSGKTWATFVSDLKKLPPNLSYNAWITTVEAIFRKHCFNVLSAGYLTRPTVSLYHHSTTAAAIARSSAEYQHHVPASEQQSTDAMKEPKYLVIRGDLNKIQHFIFKTKNPQAVRKATSKRLRGRSFTVQLLGDAVVTFLLDSLELGVTSIITNAGGNFTILAPNTPKTQQRLKDAIITISQEILERFNDDLGVTITWVTATNEDLIDYHKLETKLGNALMKRKTQPFYDLLITLDASGNKTWNQENWERLFTPSTDLINRAKCGVCDTPKENENDSVCIECQSHENIGEALAKAIGIIRRKITRNPSPKKAPLPSYQILGYEYLFFSKEDLQSSFISSITNSTFIFFSPDHFLFSDALERNNACTFQYVGLSIPQWQDNQVISFDHLARISKGYDRIGIFKADIDNLGYIFSKGRTGEEKQRSLAQIKDLSTRVDLFFSSFTIQLASKPQYQLWFSPCQDHESLFLKASFEDNQTLYRIDSSKEKAIETITQCQTCTNSPRTPAIYSIFAGGDDLALVGPWDLVLEFAHEFREKLLEYVAHNPLITISAGIGLFEDKYPIGRAIHFTEELLEQSKSLIQSKSKQGLLLPVKNSITAFGDTVLWQNDTETYPYHKISFGDFGELFKQAKTIEQAIIQKNFSRGFIHSLILLWQQYFEDLPIPDRVKKRTQEVRYYPFLAYQTARMNETNPEKKQEHFKLLTRAMPWILIPGSWALYRTKNSS